MTKPRVAEENHNRHTTPITSAKIAPFTAPTRTSRRITRQTLEPVRSFVAIARTATVRLWVPAFPPIEATIGIKTASATKSLITPSNWAITRLARTAVTRFTASHGKRRLVVLITRSVRLPSPTPARRRMSSSCSSSKTTMASSMVITPTSRPSSSTTGAEIK